MPKADDADLAPAVAERGDPQLRQTQEVVLELPGRARRDPPVGPAVDLSLHESDAEQILHDALGVVLEDSVADEGVPRVFLIPALGLPPVPSRILNGRLSHADVVN